MTFQAIKIDKKATREALRGIKNGAEKALTRAINKSLTGLKTDSVREVVSELNIKTTMVRKRMTLNRASYSKIKGGMKCKDSSLPVGAFKGVRQTSRGVTVMIKKSKGRKILKNTFMATMPLNMGKGVRDYEADYRHKGVFRRKTLLKAGKLTPGGWHMHEGVLKYGGMFNPRNNDLVGRLPIQEIWTSSIPEVLSNADHMKTVTTKGQERMAKNLEHEIKYLLSQQK